MEKTPLHVSEAIDLINQTLDYAYPVLVVEGEVASFKVNQNKFVFFDLKDASGTLGCFMMVYQLRVPIEDGMNVQVVAQPKLTQWGKFSLTVRSINPVGEGSLRRAFELLKTKLDREGLFAPERKRTLPRMPRRIGVISSTQAAGYADFIKILNERWGGIEVHVANVTVQGTTAPAQIVRAIGYFNQLEILPDVLVIIRGGGSADDLAAFNDEPLVRAIAASRIPVLTGIGHEVDMCLADLAADVRASTPSHAAEILVPDRTDILMTVQRDVEQMSRRLTVRITDMHDDIDRSLKRNFERLERRYEHMAAIVKGRMAVLGQLDPRLALQRGYSLLRNEQGHIMTSAQVGDTVTIETKITMIEAEVTNVKNK